MALPDNIQRFIDEQAERADTSFDDLRAVVFNGTTKRSPEVSNTDGLVAIVRGIFDRVGVELEEIRTVDRDIPPGLWPDMREHGYDSDEFPDLYRRFVVPAHILIIAGPIWLGDQSSLTRKIIERLYAYSSDVNEAGQWSYYGKIGAAITTGNDDGGKHVSAQVLYALQHIGLTIPPQSDTYWTGEAGPGPSYLDAVGGGEHNAWATRNTVFMAWNVLHLARMLTTPAASRPTGTRRTTGTGRSRPPQPRAPAVARAIALTCARQRARMDGLRSSELMSYSPSDIDPDDPSERDRLRRSAWPARHPAGGCTFAVARHVDTWGAATTHQADTRPPTTRRRDTL